MHKYSDCIAIKGEFVPVFSRDADVDGRWKQFFPHETFIKILRDLTSSLLREKSADNLSHWIHGAYGTGKTYASIVIKHLLEDGIKDVTDYLKQNSIQQYDIDRFVKARQGKNVLVVHRSSSSEIANSQLLFNAIQSSIRQSVSDRGFDYNGGETAYDSILHDLKAHHSPVNFANIMRSYPEYFAAYPTPQSVIDSLEKNGPEGSNSLLGDILDAMVKSGFNPIRSADDVKKWIEDVIDRNRLDSLIFIWDEFGDYFRNDPGSTSLQEVAHLSARCPFYFILITHKDIGQFFADADRRKILEARFHNNHIQLPNATAIDLVSRVVSAVDRREEELENIRISLSQRVERSSKEICGSLTGTNVAGPLRQLLPMHPFTSYILTIFSQSISSNQRTMFKFVESRSEDGNFNWFIDQAEVGQLMTIDCLWDYFFREDNPDLDEPIRQRISYYSIHSGDLDTDTAAVFKALMLLSALEFKTNAASPLLRPTLFNLTLAFEGTRLDMKVPDCCRELVQKRVINVVPQQGGDELYITSSGANFDTQELNEQKRVLRDEWRLDRVLLVDPGPAVQSALDYKGAMNLRFSFHHLTKDSFFHEAAKLRNAAPNQIPVCFLYSLTEEDTTKCRELIKRELPNLANCLLVETDVPLTEKSYDEFISNLATSHFCEKSGDLNNAKYYKDEAWKTVENWRRQVFQKTLTAYGPGGSGASIFADVSALKKHLEITNLRLFPWAIEHICDNDNMFRDAGFSEKTAKMGMDKWQLTGTLYALRDKLKRQSVWDDRSFWDKPGLSELSIARTKQFVESYIGESFDKHSQFSVHDLWCRLKEAPYGFMKSPAAVFVVGFLLREYGDGEYYFQDATGNTQILNADTLAEIIDLCIKEIDKAADYGVFRMKPEHRVFCDDMVTVFHLQKASYTLSSMKRSIRESLTRTKLPIWAAKSYASSLGDGVDEDVTDIIDLLTRYVAPKEDTDEQEIADQIIGMGYKQHLLSLARCFEIDSLKAGMRSYMLQCEPQLDDLCRSVELTADELVQRLDAKITAESSWLWEQATFEEQISAIYTELQLVQAVNCVVPNKWNSIEQARAETRMLLRSTKIAHGLLVKHSQSLGDFIARARVLSDDDSNLGLHDMATLAQLIGEKSDEIISFFKSTRKLFVHIVSDVLGEQANEEVCSEMYGKLDEDAYDSSIGEYEDRIADLYRANVLAMKLDALRQQWKNRTDTDSPADWSKRHCIPIACLFEGDISKRALPIFGILNNGTVEKLDEVTLDAALAFVENDDSLSILNDNNGRDSAFLAYFALEYAALIHHKVNEYKEFLSNQLGNDVGAWLSDKTSYTRLTKQFVQEVYHEALLGRALSALARIGPEEAKAMIEKLVRAEPLVGIKVLQDLGGGDHD